MTYFSKNMIIVLLTAFLSVTILDMFHMSVGIEGMKSSSNEGEETIHKDGDSEKKDDKDEDKPKKDDDKNAKNDEDNPKKDEDKPNKDEVKSDETSGSKPKSGGSSKQGMAKMSPANYDGKDHGDDKTSNNGNRIDYASTLEQAYDNIENIIGEDGVRGLTDQTKSLMNQQKQLMENMKDMGPLLKSAEGFMKQITGGGGISGITDMLKGFVPGK
jgi:hypothetical protein